MMSMVVEHLPKWKYMYETDNRRAYNWGNRGVNRCSVFSILAHVTHKILWGWKLCGRSFQFPVQCTFCPLNPVVLLGKMSPLVCTVMLPCLMMSLTRRGSYWPPETPPRLAAPYTHLNTIGMISDVQWTFDYHMRWSLGLVWACKSERLSWSQVGEFSSELAMQFGNSPLA